MDTWIVKNTMAPELVDPDALSAKRLLVVAPHPDDESLGCGGVITAFSKSGRAIHVIFVTDGGASHLDSPTWPRNRLRMQRELEAIEALGFLGVGRSNATFLRLRDAAMPHPETRLYREAIAAMKKVIAEFDSDLVLLPWRRDPHCDHRDSWSLANQALSEAGVMPERLEYAIWLDEIGHGADWPRPDEAQEIRFDISAVLSSKLNAVCAHRSQTTGLITDAPSAFQLSRATISRLAGPIETYWRPL